MDLRQMIKMMANEERKEPKKEKNLEKKNPKLEKKEHSGKMKKIGGGK